MRYQRVILTICLAFSALPAFGQQPITIRSTPINLYTQCFNDAITNNRVYKTGTNIQFKCWGDVGQRFYEELGRYGFTTVERDWGNGKYRVRFTTANESDNCWQKVEMADGSATSDYGCNLYFSAGAFLNM